MPSNDNFNPSNNANLSLENEAREEYMHLEVAQIIPEIAPSEENMHVEVAQLNPQI